MKKWTAMFSGMAIATLLLTGCGTATSNQVKEKPSSNNTQDNAVQTDQANTSSDSSSTSKDTNTSETKSVTQETGTSEPTTKAQASETTNEKTLQYVFNKENKEESALLKTSDNQPFSLYVLPKFELSAEEPGKDVVLLSENDRIFMRIELLPTDVDWVKTEKDAKAFLNAISDSITDPGLSIDNGSSYEVTSKNDVVTVALLKSDKAPVRITMFTTKDADYRDAFLQMAKTVQKR